MLASPVETAAEAFGRMGAGAVWTEEKYDGVRCQLHRQGARLRHGAHGLGDEEETPSGRPQTWKQDVGDVVELI